MIPLHTFDIDGECQHCHKTKLGAFGVEINSRRLSLCYKCLANMIGVFGEEPDNPDQPRPEEPEAMPRFATKPNGQ
jgi:hypothetical protein